jgi:hypothetical protein
MDPTAPSEALLGCVIEAASSSQAIAGLDPSRIALWSGDKTFVSFDNGVTWQ